MASKYCYNCGAELDEGANFCGQCGADVIKEELEPNNETIEQQPINETNELKINNETNEQQPKREEEYKDIDENQSNDESKSNRTKIITGLIALIVVAIVIVSIVIINNNNNTFDLEEDTETELLYSVDGKYIDKQEEDEDNYYDFDSVGNTYKAYVDGNPKNGTYTIDDRTGKIELDDNTVLYTDNQYVYSEELRGDVVADYANQEVAWLYTDTEDNDGGSSNVNNTYIFSEDGTVTENFTYSYLGQTIPMEDEGTYTVDKNTGLFTLTFDELGEQTMICKNGKMYYYVYQ